MSSFEEKTYEIIEESGEIQTSNLPDRRMVEAVSNLKAKGLVTVFKKYTSLSHKRKEKFVELKPGQQ